MRSNLYAIGWGLTAGFIMWLIGWSLEVERYSGTEELWRGVLILTLVGGILAKLGLLPDDPEQDEIMNTCKTCYHWSDKEKWPHYSRHRACRHPRFNTFESCKELDTMCDNCGHDGEGLTTGPDFGCIHHTPKE